MCLKCYIKAFFDIRRDRIFLYCRREKVTAKERRIQELRRVKALQNRQGAGLLSLRTRNKSSAPAGKISRTVCIIELIVIGNESALTTECWKYTIYLVVIFRPPAFISPGAAPSATLALGRHSPHWPPQTTRVDVSRSRYLHTLLVTDRQTSKLRINSFQYCCPLLQYFVNTLNILMYLWDRFSAVVLPRMFQGLF